MKTAKHKMILKSFSALSFDSLSFRQPASPEAAPSPPRPAPDSAQGFNVHPHGSANGDSWRGGDRQTHKALTLSAKAPPATVLVLEHDPEMRAVLGEVLERAGYATTLAAYGSEALRRYDPSQTDVVVLDLDAPGHDGWDTFDRMMALHPQPAILMLAGRSRPEGLTMAGTPEVLMQRPIQVPTLLQAVRTVLTESGAERATRVALQQNFARFARPYALAPRAAQAVAHWGINE
jgi:CheY-like chemotaxis protein